MNQRSNRFIVDGEDLIITPPKAKTETGTVRNDKKPFKQLQCFIWLREMMKSVVRRLVGKTRK